MIMPPLPPSPEAAAGLPPTYYRSNPHQYTSAEHWRVAGLRGVVIVWWKKLTGQPLWNFGGIPSPSPLRADVLPRQEISPPALQALDELRRVCEPLGFGDPIYHANKHGLTPSDTASCALRQPSGETVANLSYLQSFMPRRPPHRLVTFHTSLTSHGSLLTSNRRRLYDSAPGDDRRFLPGLSALTLYLEHCRRLEVHRARGHPPVPVRTLEELEAVFWRDDWRGHEYRKARGVYVPMAPAEVEQARALKAARRAAWLASQSAAHQP